MRKLSSAGIAITVASGIALTGCGKSALTSGSVVAPTTGASIPAPATTQAAASPTPPATPSSSQTIGAAYREHDSDGNAYTVQAMRVIDPAAADNQFDSAPAGQKLVAVVFQVAGVSGSASDDANIDASVLGSNGQAYQASLSGVSGYTDFDSGDWSVTPGSREIGAVTFQLPEGVGVAEVSWQPGLLGTAAQWRVGP